MNFQHLTYSRKGLHVFYRQVPSVVPVRWWCGCVTFNNKALWLLKCQNSIKILTTITSFSGGFYQDEMGQVDCKNCSTGTYVPETDHPGRSATDCRACPYGKWPCWMHRLIAKIFKQVITRGIWPVQKNPGSIVVWSHALCVLRENDVRASITQLWSY